jgi:hypothetical protein
MEAEMSLSISSWESKITDRLLPLLMVIVLAVVLVLVLVVLGFVRINAIVILAAIELSVNIWRQGKICGIGGVLFIATV